MTAKNESKKHTLKQKRWKKIDTSDMISTLLFINAMWKCISHIFSRFVYVSLLLNDFFFALPDGIKRGEIVMQKNYPF